MLVFTGGLLVEVLAVMVGETVQEMQQAGQLHFIFNSLIGLVYGYEEKSHDSEIKYFSQCLNK